MFSNPFFQAFAVTIVIAILGWVMSLVRRDASIADFFWPWLGVVSAGVYLINAASPTSVALVVFGIVVVGAVRLALFVAMRLKRQGEDRRYAEIRQRWRVGFALKSLPGIFLLQAIMGFLLAIPLSVVMIRSNSWAMLDIVALLVWLGGFSIQVIADQQLTKFAANDTGSGVLQTGIWRYSRHPNYFGELCMGWGLFAFAVSGGGAWTVFAPLLLTWSILRFTGISRMEKGILSRRPCYASYVQATSPLVPWPPRRIEKCRSSHRDHGRDRQ